MRAFARISLLGAALLLAAPLLPLHAQDDAGGASAEQDPVDPAVEYSERFDHGIQALTEGRYQEGIDDFKRCLELATLFPQNSICAYNIACGYSMLEDVDQGFEWLERCATMGFGQSAGNIEHSASDVDLTNCRADAERWQAFQERMASLNAAIAEYAATPEVYVPEAIAGLEQKPVLVVLHDYGQRKEDVLSGEFRDIADALGMALVAPSGGYAPIDSDPAQGMSWYDDANAYADNIWTYQRAISEAMRHVRTEVGMDRSRVLIAGVGQGAILAFNTAVASPGLYKGVVAVGYNPQFLGLAQSRGPNAGRMGLKARFVYSEIPDVDMNVWVRQNLLAAIGPWGLDAGHALFSLTDAGIDEDSYRDSILSALRECLPAVEDSDT